MRGHLAHEARRDLLQVDQDPAALALHRAQGVLEAPAAVRAVTPEDVAEHALLVNAAEHGRVLAGAALDEREVLEVVDACFDTLMARNRPISATSTSTSATRSTSRLAQEPVPDEVRHRQDQEAVLASANARAAGGGPWSRRRS
jgi:acetyl-CoA carboxylase carboxyltransferase component